MSSLNINNATTEALSSIQAPYETTLVVKPEWLDGNGHMNVAYYLSAFDDGTEVFFGDVGLDWAYTSEGVGTIFIADSNLSFYQELMAGDELRITTRLFDFDHKRLHLYLELYRVAGNVLAACSEMLYLHVSFATRRSSPMPDSAYQRLQQILPVHQQLPAVSWLGRKIGIRR